MPRQVKRTWGNISFSSLTGSILKTTPKKSRKSRKNCILKIHETSSFASIDKLKEQNSTYAAGVNGPIITLQTSFLPRAINAAVIL